jgi:polyhydroxybutyrate depolymerase
MRISTVAGAALCVAIAGLLSAACGSGPQPALPPTPLAPVAPTAAQPEPPRPATDAAALRGAGARWSPGCGAAVPLGDSIETLLTDQGDRPYRLHIPARYTPGSPSPLVLNFHGYARTAIEQEVYSGLIPLSDQEGFILVTPEGSGHPQAWDIPGIYAENGFDDVGFVAQLLVRLEHDLCIDSARVFATGMSNGAEMAALVACRLGEKFAAVAPVAGVIFDACEGEPVPIIAFHGTFDFNVPFESAPHAVLNWARFNGCTGAAVTTEAAGRVRLTAYADCAGGDTVLYIVDGGGHTWPGAPDDSGGVGPTTHEIDASALMWAFFAAHPKRRDQ